ncbi:hypothetical protein [Streptomyces sp. CC208A]|uniref:hypothetical protein n=1 Tax=Streptomyces sp. CC208A TaxID=3044573 RepID=UPI0024A7FF96|nr:hypothetical protein [Streptomyces sp. CC208A]
MTRTWAARRQRAADRQARRTVLHALLDRADRLTEAEAAVVREYALAEAAEADQLRDTARGQDQAVKELSGRLVAAEDAIREAERDRDAAREELAAIRAYDRALVEDYGPAHPRLFGVGGTFCGTCRAWVPGRLSLPHTCPRPATAVVELLRDGDGQPICTCTWAGLDTTRLCPRHDEPTSATKES